VKEQEQSLKLKSKKSQTLSETWVLRNVRMQDASKHPSLVAYTPRHRPTLTYLYKWGQGWGRVAAIPSRRASKHVNWKI